MGRSCQRKSARKRVGQVSYYRHHGSWYIYYLDGKRQVRRRVSDDEETAARLAAQIDAQFAADLPTQFSFTPISVAGLQQRFLDHHEHVARSSLSTISRYRSASQHLIDHVEQRGAPKHAHQIDADDFVRHPRHWDHHLAQASVIEGHSLEEIEMANRIRAGKGFGGRGQLGGDPFRDLVFVEGVIRGNERAIRRFSEDYRGYLVGLARNRFSINEDDDDWWSDLLDLLGGYSQANGKLTKFTGRCGSRNWLGTLVRNFLTNCLAVSGSLSNKSSLDSAEFNPAVAAGSPPLLATAAAPTL